MTQLALKHKTCMPVKNAKFVLAERSGSVLVRSIEV